MRVRDQKKLHQEKKTSLDLSSVLIRLSSFALSQANPERIISQTLKETKKIFNAKLCWMFLVEDNKIKLKSLGETKSWQKLIKSQLLPKLSPEILNRSYPIICNHIGGLYKKNRVLYRFLRKRNIQKFMGILLKKDGKLVGALNLAKDSASPNFTREDLKSLALLGKMTVMAKLKRAEETSKQSRDFLEAIIDNIPNPIFIKDRNHCYVVLNQAVSTLVGYLRKTILGKSDYNFFPKEQADFFWKKDEQMFRTGKVVDIPEEPITDKKGKIHYLHTKKAPLKDSSGRITHLVGIIEDITERKQAEAKLKESEEKYKTLVETSTDIIFMVDLKGNFLFTNKAFEKNLGYSDEEIKKINGFKLVHPEDLEIVKQQFAQLVEGKSVDNMEYRYKTKNGFYINILNNASPIFDSEGNIVAALGIARDITERKKAEEKLKLFSHSVDSSVDGIAMGDLEGKITHANEAFIKMFGYSREELIGKEIALIYAENQVPKLEKALKATREGAWRGDLVGKRKDGTLFPVAISASRVLDNEGKVIAHMASHTDVTERKRAEEALIRNERISRERARLLTDLRSLDRIDDILTRVCETIRDSELFERAVMTLHDAEARILHLGQVGLPPDVVERARQAPPLDQNLRARITKKKFRISDSFFVPVEAGVDFSKSGRYVPQKQRNSVDGDWQQGDELFVPLCDFSGKIMGYLSVDTPMDGCRPDVKTIEALEMMVEAAASRVREVEAQQVLKRERDFSKSILETANSLVVCLDADAKITVFNHECERVTGYRREEVLGKSWPELFLPSDHHRFKSKSFAKWVRAHPRDRYEGPILTKSGEIRIILWSNTAIIGSGERDVVAIAIGHDITERKRMEEALRTSQDRYTLCTKAANVGVWDWDIKTNKFYLDPIIKEILGYKDEEIPNDIKVWVTYVHPDDRGPVMTAAQACIDGKTTEYVIEHRMMHKNGSVRWILSRGNVIRDAKGNTVRMVGTDTDITERKQAEEALQRSERKYRTLVETAQEGIGISDKEENIIFVNQAFANLLGYKKEELLGKNLKEICDEAHYVMFRKETQKRKKGDSSKYEVKLLTKKGNPKYFYVSAAPLSNEDRSFMGTLAVLSDLTEIKKAREYNILLDTSRALSRTLRFDRVLKIGAEEMIQVLNADRCAILISEDGTKSSTLRVQIYPKKTEVLPSVLELRATPAHISSYKRLLQAQKYLMVVDPRAGSLPELARTILRKTKMISGLIIPLLIGRKMLGVFHVGTEKKRKTFAEEEIRLALTMANQVAVALENCRLMESLEREHSRIVEQAEVLKRQTEEKDILLRVSRSLSKTINLDEVSQVASHVVGSAMGVERCAVTLATEDGNQLELKGLFSKEHIDAHKSIGTKFLWDDIPAMTKTIKKGKPFVINDISNVPSKSKTREYFRKVGIKSVLGAGMFFGKKLMGILSITSIKKQITFTQEETKLVQTMANQIAIAIENARLMQVVKKRTQDLRDLSAELMKVQENERKRIAQELHDEVGQMLQSMKMSLDRIKMNLRSKPQKLDDIQDWLLDTENLLANTIDEIRTLTFDLRPSMLDDFGLIPTLRWFIENYSRRSNIQVSLKTKDQRYRFPPDIEVTLYRIIQEALTNVAKHAHATQASILVSPKNSTAFLSVRDNGVGFDVRKALSHPMGMGLLNIKERVNLLGGSLEIITRPRKGTRLNINIPFKEVKREEG